MADFQLTPIYLAPHNPTVGGGLPPMAAWQPVRMLDQIEYISVVWVTAAMGSALTAGHFWKRAPKVTKRALAPPLGTSLRLGVPVIRQ
ncbi:hypothetical protein TX23_04850 [Pseudomonas paralactis]|uniref:Uncharacterized protein n=1 Tax=Pseudomonas paralactis TaxID=1615673 RepID=A0A0R3APU0_9PSED|nr:hypothetical protein TX23_04850 [Pseudomonas paralactis]